MSEKTSLTGFLILQLIDYYVREKYTLRYTGGMVPDVNQVLYPTRREDQSHHEHDGELELSEIVD